MILYNVLTLSYDMPAGQLFDNGVAPSGKYEWRYPDNESEEVGNELNPSRPHAKLRLYKDGELYCTWKDIQVYQASRIRLRASKKTIRSRANALREEMISKYGEDFMPPHPEELDGDRYFGWISGDDDDDLAALLKSTITWPTDDDKRAMRDNARKGIDAEGNYIRVDGADNKVEDEFEYDPDMLFAVPARVEKPVRVSQPRPAAVAPPTVKEFVEPAAHFDSSDSETPYEISDAEVEQLAAHMEPSDSEGHLVSSDDEFFEAPASQLKAASEDAPDAFEAPAVSEDAPDAFEALAVSEDAPDAFEAPAARESDHTASSMYASDTDSHASFSSAGAQHTASSMYASDTDSQVSFDAPAAVYVSESDAEATRAMYVSESEAEESHDMWASDTTGKLSTEELGWASSSSAGAAYASSSDVDDLVSLMKDL